MTRLRAARGIPLSVDGTDTTPTDFALERGDCPDKVSIAMSDAPEGELFPAAKAERSTGLLP
jgi:hypothetical protein